MDFIQFDGHFKHETINTSPIIVVYAKPVNTPRNLQFEEEQWYFNVSTSF